MFNTYHAPIISVSILLQAIRERDSGRRSAPKLPPLCLQAKSILPLVHPAGESTNPQIKCFVLLFCLYHG